MEHQAALIETLAIGLGAAFIGGMLARRLRLPTMVGYLVAGIAVGPFTPGLVADPEIAPQLAELGVILLMFGVGIHFSIPELLAVRGIAVPGAMGQVVVATILGTGLGIALGWGITGGLVLGLAISVASTVVLLRALMERNELDTPQGRIAVGWLIVEDLFTVVVLVLLPTLAPVLSGGEADLGSSLVGVLVAVGKAVVFAALMLVAGRRIVPWILGAVARERSRELFTLAVLAAAVGIGFAASAIFGVSFALGAFLAGVVLSESDLSHQAAADALPLRDAFAVLFFVSVGMLMDPGYLVREPVAVLAVTLLIVGAKSIAAFVIVAAFGYSVRVALTVGAALAQIGEFSFILATVGRALDLIPPDAFQLVVAGSLVSITLNAGAFRLVEPLEAWIRARPAVLEALERPARGLSHLYPGRREELRGHAILCGYGRVGRLVAAALERRGLQYVVVSDDRREVERLRERGISALYGDAANEELLGEAHLPRARVVIVALPDAHAARLVVDRVRDKAPRVPLVVRTHGAAEASFLRRLGPSVQAVHAEREVAIQLTRFSLRRFGLSTIEVDAIASGLRDRDRAEAGTGAAAGPSAGTLESLRRWVERLRSAAAREVALEASAGLEAAGAGAEVSPADGAEPRAAAATARVEADLGGDQAAAAAQAEAATARVEAATARVEADLGGGVAQPPVEAAPTRVEADLGAGADRRAEAGEPPAPSVLSGPSKRALKSLRQWFERRRSAFAREVPPHAPTALEDSGTEGATPGAGPDRSAERDLSAELSGPAEPSALSGPTEPSAQSGQAGPAEGALEPLRRWFERRRSAFALEVPQQASTAPEDARAEPPEPQTTLDSRAEATKPRAEPAGSSGGTLESLRRWFEQRRSAFARAVSPQASTARENAGAEPAEPQTEPDSPAEPAGLPAEPAATPRPKPARPRAKPRAEAAEPAQLWAEPAAQPAEPAATPRPKPARPRAKPRAEPAEPAQLWAEPAALPAEPAATPRPKPARPRAKPRAEAADTSPDPLQPLEEAAKRQSKPRAEAGEPPVPPQPQSEAAVTPRARAARPRGRSAPPAAPE